MEGARALCLTIQMCFYFHILIANRALQHGRHGLIRLGVQTKKIEDFNILAGSALTGPYWFLKSGYEFEPMQPKDRRRQPRGQKQKYKD